jgi:hypothetical protein
VRSEKDGGGWLVQGIKPVSAKIILLNSRVPAVSAVEKWFQDTLLRYVHSCLYRHFFKMIISKR